MLNVQSTGQGHATVFPRVVAGTARHSGRNRSSHRHGNSNNEIPGFASVASRSAITAGGAIVKTIDTMLAKGKTIAANVLEAAEADIAYKDGRFEVVGTDRRISLFDLAARAKEMKARGEIPEDLDTKTTAETPQTFPNGCHVAEVEIDPDTGHVALISYTAVDDCGNVLDHMIVEGQFHGSLAMGLGQAVARTHRLRPRRRPAALSGSFMDYAMPRAVDMPVMRDAVHSVPATTNPLGVKGVGEAATTGAIATVMSAIADAIPGDAGARSRCRRRRRRSGARPTRGDARPACGLTAAAIPLATGGRRADTASNSRIQRKPEAKPPPTPSRETTMRFLKLWLLAVAGLVLHVPRRSRPSASRAQRHGLLHAGRHDGRRAGQRQARGLDHHHHGGDQREGRATASRPTAIEPGKYTITIRAVGYILDGPKSVEVPAGGNAKADLKLNRARNIQLQLSNAEWMQSLPGTDRDKQFLTGCTGCHTLQRLFTAQHDVDEWIQVFNRMGRYYPGSTPAQPQLLVRGGARSERPRVDPKIAAGGGAVPGRRQPHQSGGQGIRVQAAAAAEGPRHPGDHHRVRSAAEERLSA